MFIRWAARKPRQWCDASEIEHFEHKEHRKGKTQVMKPDECRRLLTVAEENFPETVPAFVLMLFMGVRPREITTLTDEHVTEDGVTIPDEYEATDEDTKTGRRFIHMTPEVAAWLKAYPVQETVAPMGWQRKWDAVRRMAGWSVKADLLDQVEWKVTPDLPGWHQDILRHTAATVLINIGKPISVLIFEHGHSQGETTIKKNYLGRMTKKQAVEITSMGPGGEKLAAIQGVA